MRGMLPINVESLLYCRGVESARIEFKAGWDEKVTGPQVLKTICAFANDLQNLNGGYVVIGVAEQSGCAVLPPQGLRPESLDRAQNWLRGHCNQLDPKYQPIFAVEEVDGKQLLVIWAPGSETRPHSAPAGKDQARKYYVRIGSETVDAAANGVLIQLLQLTARVPFDDRRALGARIEDLREGKVREFLNDIRSGLLDERQSLDIYRKMRIVAPVNGHDVPRNIGLLMFSEHSEQWFPGARIEVVQFAGGLAGDVVEEKFFRGGIHEQLRNALAYMEQFAGAHLEKDARAFQVKGWVSYPVPALREALVNAVYHRGYESEPEPVKVYLHPDRVEVISYPGPVPGIGMEHLLQQASMPPVPARNRRVGEFLKELRLAEGRGTGLPKLFKVMRENGSPDPRFDFDSDRSYFRVTLPAHPEYVAIATLRDAAHLRAIGREVEAVQRVEEQWRQLPHSPTLTVELLRLLGGQGRLTEAGLVFERFGEVAPQAYKPLVTNVMVELLHQAGQSTEAKRLLDTMAPVLAGRDALDTAILARRLDKEEQAHRYFEKAGEEVLQDPRALLEYAQCKMALAGKALRGKSGKEVNRRLLREAMSLLERVLALDTERVRHAWAWRELSRVKNWLQYPPREVRAALEEAVALCPEEQRFRADLERLAARPTPH